jgi:aminoglycoside/choline kinase family phosphotransferase
MGGPPSAVQLLKGDGSQRELYRMHGAGTTVIAVWNPHGPAENSAFVGLTGHFRRHGLPVPAIVAAALDAGAYLEEDLGDLTLLLWLEGQRDDRWSEATLEMYRKVVQYLPRFQAMAGASVDYDLCYQGKDFDAEAMLGDLRYFEQEFLDPFAKGHPDVHHDFTELATCLDLYPRDSFMYRDFQARNVMLVAGEPWFLDYQSGRRGPAPYDVASLLFDGAVEMPETTRQALLDVYLDAMEEAHPLDRGAFLAAFPGFALLRILQALGAYGFLSRHRSKRHFLRRVPAALRNLDWLARHWSARLPGLVSLWRAIEELQQQPHLGYLA